ncbi:MAG: tRNA epoxyqueuosine(34) reductase QueG [Chthoniobacteraceae bacterium]
MNPAELKTTFLTEARALGFDVCRVAAAEKPPHAAEFREWLGEEKHGDMAWLERNADRRTDPDLVLPGARSIIVLGMNYWNRDATPDPQSAIRNPQSPSGRIARYAWGDDYHDIIGPRLSQLDAWLQKHGGAQRQYVDTGPVLERDFAALSGLGWQGKSTMLIHPKLGTWLFLASILTTLELPPDEPMPDHCGKCTRCITACPTSAITAPHELDARLCISYLTIENKGPIPESLRPLIGDRIYGCDDCLDACPWNRFAHQSRESRFAAREFVTMPLRDFLALDDDAFRTLFRGSPIKRIKRPRFLRNVCVALGNIGTSDDLSALEIAATDPDSLIAEHAQWAIEQIHTRNAQTTSPAPTTGAA